MSQTVPAVSVSRRIDAPAGAIFALLTSPDRHREFDGSEMIHAAVGDPVVSAAGQTFRMEMRSGRMGDYEMANHVVVYEAARQIVWEPEMTRAGKPEHADRVGRRMGHRWGYSLDPVDDRCTDVTHSYDCSAAPEWLQEAVGGGELWRTAMADSLARLDLLVTGSRA